MKIKFVITLAALGVATVFLPGCSSVDTLSYRQLGACNGSGRTRTFAGVNQAYVLFSLDTLTVPAGASAFTLDPTKFYTIDGLGNHRYYDPNVNMNNQELGPFKVQDFPAPANNSTAPLSLNLNAYLFIVVGTTASDGASEANQSQYTLYYNGPNGILLTKTPPSPLHANFLNCDDLTADLGK